MKKILLSLCSLLAAFTVASAQDVNEATDVYNKAVEKYSMRELEAALQNFVKAHELAKQCGEDGAEIVADCENNIPGLGNQIANDLAEKGDYAKGVAVLKEVVEICTKLGLVEDADRLTKRIPQFFLQQAGQFVKVKDYTQAITAYNNVLSYDPTNGSAFLQLGQVLLATGDEQGGLNALESAIKNGQEKKASRQLANYFLKKAKSASTAKNYESALENAKKALTYNPEEANAYYLGGIAAQALTKNAEAISLFEIFCHNTILLV